MEKVLKYRKNEGAQKLSIYRENPLLARLLVQRGIDTDEKAEQFLNPDESLFLPLSVFKDGEKTLNRLISAIETGEKAVVYGDFDTDGVSSTAILYKTLKHFGANVGRYIPSRDAESHGLNTKAIINLISKEHAKLIITVDCGISNTKEISLAKSLGTQIIVTDHHEAPDELPDAYAIINPKAGTKLVDTLTSAQIRSLCNLCGAGIAFKISVALCRHFGDEKFIDEILPLAALGTVGDIVPLTDENRFLTTKGLELIKQGVNPGLKVLLETAGITNFEKVTSETLTYGVVPRINACGRLSDATAAFRLLTSEDASELADLAKELDDLNKLRKDLCDEAYEKVSKILENPEDRKHAAVICDDGFHIGIIGIVAAKIVENYNIPAFIMRSDDGFYRCSCRAPEGINVHEVLKANGEYFKGFGGHEAAGGFSFDSNVVSFEKIKRLLREAVIAQTGGEALIPTVYADLKLTADEINEKLLETIDSLEPFGAANPAPLFVIGGSVERFFFMGNNANHLKIFLNSDDKIFECIKWKCPTFDAERGEKLDIAFYPRKNTYNSVESIQLMAQEIFFTESRNKRVPLKIADLRNKPFSLEKLVDYIEKTDFCVKIFAEKKQSVEFLSKFEPLKKILVDRHHTDKNVQTLILYDLPPSSEILRSLRGNQLKTVYLLNSDYEENSPDKFLAKLTGMSKFCQTHKQGKSTLSDFAKALCVDTGTVKCGLEILADTNVIRAKFSDDENICVKFNEPVSVEKIRENERYDILTDILERRNLFLKKLSTDKISEREMFEPAVLA